MPNQFCWYELITSDPQAAKTFYGAVAGWTFTDSGLPGMDYSIIHANGVPLGGVMSLENGPPPSWFGYVAVDDVDGYADKVKAAGGTVHMGPSDIPQVGRFAMVADPQGAPFVLFKGLPGMDMALPPFMTAGSISWHELNTSDWEAGFAFYSGLFGWTKDTPVDMGPMGTYQLFAAGGNAIGGMFNIGSDKPHWLYYIGCDDIDAAEARVKAAGGTVPEGPMEVPGGAWVIPAIDPQGALFAMVGMRPNPPA
ncbi:VOC family protein [Sphingomonas crocodyli]|uniref:VOC family protein n=1 Tax=Sphingomonas crocodyli TaxID=1979270 RepID=A0A437M4N6_9SPHN|nr:VOC family protein [Sphingomonas crocodyli]RVT92525.1 VOC family protein [Sphingomonas crocodyli]